MFYFEKITYYEVGFWAGHNYTASNNFLMGISWCSLDKENDVENGVKEKSSVY